MASFYLWTAEHHDQYRLEMLSQVKSEPYVIWSFC